MAVGGGKLFSLCHRSPSWLVYCISLDGVRLGGGLTLGLHMEFGTDRVTVVVREAR